MSRFIGILLMTITGAVAADLACHAILDPWGLGIALGISLAIIGLLFGFLDSHRHAIWSSIAAVVVCVSLYRSNLPPDDENRPPTPPPPSPLTAAHYPIPWIAFLAGSFLGARIITSKVRANTQPQAEFEP